MIYSNMLANNNNNNKCCCNNNNIPFVQCGRCIVPFCKHGNACKKSN